MRNWLRTTLWRHVIGLLVTFFAIFPLYLVILSAFSSSGSLEVTSFIPSELSIKNFKVLFTSPTIPYLVWMKNTLVISGLVAILS